MRALRSLVLVVCIAAGLGACGSDDSPTIEGSDTTTTAAGATATTVDISALPQALRDAKVLKVGSDVAYAPVEFFKEGTQEVQGIDPDMCAAAVSHFGEGWTCAFENTTFDGLIPALEAKRFDIIMSAMSDTPERQGKLDFVDYFNAGTSILVKKGNPEKIASLDDLCGKTIGLQRGTTQEDLAKDQASKCARDGKGKLEVLTFEKDTDALLQLKNGRTVADMNDFPVAAYSAKTSGGGADFEVVGEQLGAGPYGIGVRKDDTALRDALAAALRAALADGSYAKVLETWDVAQGALAEITVNGGK